VHPIIRVLMLMLLMFTLPGLKAQQNFPPIEQNPSSSRTPDLEVPPDMQKKMEKKANEQRQAELKRDTDKLLKLSTELKNYVDKSNENVLSLDVIKKAEEIERLAHNVRIKMRGNP
jgi:hypothetical protein